MSVKSFFSGLHLSKKLVTSVVTSVLTIAAAYVVQKYGIHESVGTAALVSGIIGQVAGAFAGWFVKEV